MTSDNMQKPHSERYQICLLHPRKDVFDHKSHKHLIIYLVFWTRFSKRKKSGYWNWEYMAGDRLPKGYPYYTDNPSYKYQDYHRKLLFWIQIVHRSEMYISLWFWFLNIFAKNNSYWTRSLFSKILHIEYPIFLDR